MSHHPTDPGLPPLQPEDYLAMLRNVCIAMWASLLVALLVQGLIRLSPEFDWPVWGNFSWTYNLVLLEFGMITAVLTYLLSRQDWLERAPREAIGHLRLLLLVILVLDGLHFLAAFQVSGSLYGPMIILVPVLILTLYLMLPRFEANVVNGIFVCVLLILLAAQAYGIVESRGLLADAFDLSAGQNLPYVTVVIGCIAAALLIGQAARDNMDSAGISLQRSRMFDLGTGLFTREILEHRIPGELRRIDRRESSAALLLIEINDFDKVNANCGYEAGTKAIRELAGGLRRVTRANGDTCALYAPTTFAALLPTAGAAAATQVAERIIEFANRIDTGTDKPGIHLAIGLVATSDTKQIEAREFKAAADLALTEALQDSGHRIVSKTL